jgi:hypothetical protein
MICPCKELTVNLVVERKDGGRVLFNDPVIALLGLRRGIT